MINLLCVVSGMFASRPVKTFIECSKHKSSQDFEVAPIGEVDGEGRQDLQEGGLVVLHA